MPRAGQGTWPVTDRETCVHMVQSGLDAGYRHVDTAQMYDNEAHAGESVTPGDEQYNGLRDIRCPDLYLQLILSDTSS